MAHVWVWDVLSRLLLYIFCVMSPRLFFFFFQAEDGIRDLTVTGVQTCALPISRADGFRIEETLPCGRDGTRLSGIFCAHAAAADRPQRHAHERSFSFWKYSQALDQRLRSEIHRRRFRSAGGHFSRQAV